MNKKKIVIFLIAVFLIYIGLFFYTHLVGQEELKKRDQIGATIRKSTWANLEFSAVYDHSYEEVIRHTVYAICKLDSFSYKGIDVIRDSYVDKNLPSMYYIPGNFWFNDSTISIDIERGIVLKKNAHIYTFLGDSTIYYESIDGSIQTYK